MREYKHSRLWLALFCVISIFLFPAYSTALDFSKKIKEIKITGNQRANNNTIRFYIHSKTGERYSVTKTREDIRRIFALKYFDDIQLETDEEIDGIILTFRVKEKPFVKSVAFKGLKEIPKKDLKIFLKMKKGTYFQKHVLQKDINKIKERYRKKGFYFTKITPIVADAGNRQVDITYAIKENQKIKISEVNFYGNKAIEDFVLGKSMQTKPVGFWSFLGSGGNYEKESIKTDRLRIESKYRDFGYIKSRIEEPRIEVDQEKGRIMVNFFVNEGSQYFVRKITAEGDAVFTAEEILEKVTLKEGDPFNQSTFRENIFKVTEMYSDKGYAYANVMPNITEDEEAKMVDIHLKVSPGDMVYIGKITISGNDKTHGNVIRREFRFHEGELFKGSKMRRTRQRLNNTGFFGGINIEQKSGDRPDQMDLNVAVIEQTTGNFQVGFSYNSVENISLNLGITEKNLFGTGKQLSLIVSNSNLREEYSLSLTEPKFRNRDIFLRFSAFSKKNNWITYTTRTKGGDATIGRALGEYSSVKLQYKIQKVKVSLNDLASSGTYLLSLEGNNLTSSLTPIYTINTVDNIYFPTSGFKVVSSMEVAGGPFGGALNFYKAELSGNRYYALPYEFVLRLKGDVKHARGYGNQTLPLFENYFLSGSSLRGFTFDDIGPVDNIGDSIGGDSSLLLSTEINYPFSKMISAMLFYDRGQIYGEIGNLSKTTNKRYDFGKMRHSYGFGLRFLTPMGPIVMTWGFKLDRKDGEAPTQFNLNIGRLGF